MQAGVPDHLWARNLLFLGLVCAGVVALIGGLFPRATATHASAATGTLSPAVDALPVVAAIDRAFREQWSAAKLTSASPAPDLIVARRLALALTGGIPSLQEIRRLEPGGVGSLDRWLTDLFKDRRFADYFAERLARAYVGTEDGPFLIYRRRRFVSWLSDQLFKNRSYDEIVRELISDQGLWTDKPATNFVTVTVDPAKNTPDAERLAARVARAFLGVRLDCAQCHNHPFQKWKQSDFQGLAAYFGQVRPGFTGIYDGSGEFEASRKRGGDPEPVSPHVPFHPELVPKDGSRRAQLAAWVTAGQNPAFARATVNRVWALLFGRPLVEPVDDLGSADELPRVLQLLADDFAAHGYDLQRLIRTIVSTELFHLDSTIEPELTEAHEDQWAVFPLTRLRPEQVSGALYQAASLETLNGDTHILFRIFKAGGENEFVKRYGDVGEDEFNARPGTIPQRLLLMNGQLVYDNTEQGLLSAPHLIGALAADDRKAVATAYLTVLTRRPAPEEAAHFEGRLASARGDERQRRLSDLFWTLVNTTEFSWNH